MSFITNWLRGLVSQRVIQMVVRHTMTVIAGYLVALPIPQDVQQQFLSSAEQVFVAAALAGLALLWSWIDKKSTRAIETVTRD